MTSAPASVKYRLDTFMSSRWSVCKRDGIWRVYDGPHWHESWPTLPEAHTAATQLAITAEIFKPGGVTAARACVDWAAQHLVDKALRSLGWER